MSTTVVINEVPKFNLSVQQGDGPTVSLSQPDAPALTLSMSGPQGPTGPAGPAGPNSVTSATTSNGTGILSLSSLSLSTPLPLASGGTGGATASTARTNLGLGTADTPTFSNLSLNTGTITVPQPLSFTQTWNSTATFSAFQMNITDSGSANAASLLMDLRVGGVSRLSVNKVGSIFAPSLAAITGDLNLANSNSGPRVTVRSEGVSVRDSGSFGWANSSSSGNPLDLILARDATNTLAQRNGLSAQEFRLYGTYTDASNYERLKLKATGTAFQIGTEKLGATTVARPLELQTDGTTRMTISTTGNTTFTGFVAPSYLRLTGGTGEAHIYKGTGNGTVAIYNQAENAASLIDVATNGVLKVRNIGNTDYAVADAQHRLQGTAPASATAAGTAGDIRYDSDYIYICTATNTWKRTAISTWP